MSFKTEMTTYAVASNPSLVQQAESLAAQLKFTQSSLLEVGRLLHVLTSHITQGEIGSGCGIGVAWIVSVLHPDSIFITIESDRLVEVLDPLFPSL